MMRTSKPFITAVLSALALVAAAIASIVTQNDTYVIPRAAVDSGDKARPANSQYRLIPSVAEPVCSSQPLTNSQYVLRVGLFARNPCATQPMVPDCNSNSILDSCESDCNTNAQPDDCDLSSGVSADCNTDAVPDECDPPLPACHYRVDVLCDAVFDRPALIDFTDYGEADQFPCDGRREFRAVIGRLCPGTCKLTKFDPRAGPDNSECEITLDFGSLLSQPSSVYVDKTGSYSLSCPPEHREDLAFVGGRDASSGLDVIYTGYDPMTGSFCRQHTDDFDGIGQMAVDANGVLYIGSIEGPNVFTFVGGSVATAFTCPSGTSPRAIALDPDGEHLWVTCASDGTLYLVDMDDPDNPVAFATGLNGAISQVFAPPGIFHANLFVAAGDRVLEVNVMMGLVTVFAEFEAHGIAFDPEGFMHVSQPSQNRILRIGPNLPGDMDGDADVDEDDVCGFFNALLRTDDAALPIITADMNCDGCADGDDIEPFIEDVIDGTTHPPCGM